MFEFVRKHNKLFQFLLILVVVPSFIGFGLVGYSGFTEDAATAVASVDGHMITRAEWDAAQRAQLDRARQANPRIDAKLFDDPEIKREVLEGLVRDRVTQAAVQRLNIVTGDQRLQRIFATDPQFAHLRNPDSSVNKEMLAAQGMPLASFERRLRDQLSHRQLLSGLDSSVLAPASVTNAALDALLQQREIQVQRFDARDYLAKVNPSEADIEAFYKNPANAAQFQAPEQASIEFVVLDLDALKAGISVNDEDLRKYYTENASRYTVAEERRASHILVKAEKSASTAERTKAKAKAEALLAEVRRTPSSFPEVARKNSDDPGSAAKGGDLDFFGRGAMVKPFEDAIYAMKPGEISNIVESDFGYHIIQLTAVRGGATKPFDEVRAQIEGEVKTQLARAKYSEYAEQFNNLVYEQADSLAPVATKLKLEVQKATVQRAPAPNASGPLASAKFIDALFSHDVLRNKRNTDGTAITPNQMAAGRVLQYQPARMLPLADVKDRVREHVANDQAAALARKEGQARLAQVQQGGDASGLPAAVTVSRVQTHGLPREVVDAALRVDPSKLPSVHGTELAGGGYAVMRLTKVLPRDAAMADTKQSQEHYARVWGEAEAQAYYTALKARFKTEIKAPAKAASAAE